jgi:hypothetical protein
VTSASVTGLSVTERDGVAGASVNVHQLSEYPLGASVLDSPSASMKRNSDWELARLSLVLR